MTTHASGSFEVTITPQAQDAAEGSSLGRMSIDKQFRFAYTLAETPDSGEP